MKSSRRFATLLGMVLFICLAKGYAADVTGAIAGVVKDSSGAFVPNAKIAVTNKGTSARFTGTSDESGSYKIGNLPVGTYTLDAEVLGFKKFVAEDIRVQVNETARVDIALAIGEMMQTVEVSGVGAGVDTTTSTLKTVVDQLQISQLPLNGRNPTQLMQLVVGVQADPNANVTSDTTYPGVMPVSVNGGGPTQRTIFWMGRRTTIITVTLPIPCPTLTRCRNSASRPIVSPRNSEEIWAASSMP